MLKNLIQSVKNKIFTNQEEANAKAIKEVSDLFFQRKFRACIEHAKLLFDQPKYTWDAKRFAGLSLYKTRKYEEAVVLFEEIARRSNNTDDWFNLITASIRSQKIELAEEAFDRFNDPKSIKGNNGMLSYGNVTYQMMIAFQDIGAYQKALEKLIVLKRYICQVKHHNPEYLAQYRIPFIYMTLVSGYTCLQKMYTEEQIKAFLDDFEKQVDEDGKQSIAEFKSEKGIV